MRQTPIHDLYDGEAKIVDFNGWALPVQFSGIVDEHHATRTSAGLFDCSHMGEFLIRGREAIQAFSDLTFSDFTTLKQGRCRYSALLNDKAGILDDCVGLRLSEEELYVVTNAGPLEEVSAYITQHCATAEDLTLATTKIDLQGPKSREVLLRVGLDGLADFRYWSGGRIDYEGVEIIVTRAGYTGELGYELFVPNMHGPRLWQTLLNQDEVSPCGLGARDTLRTEVGYPLNGEDLAADISALESGMERFIAWDTPMPGKALLEAQRDRGDYRRLVPIQTADRRAPRHGFLLMQGESEVGVVTSGTFGPSVGTGVGLARVDPGLAEPGTTLSAGPRGLAVTVAEMPIYRAGTCRMKVA